MRVRNGPTGKVGGAGLMWLRRWAAIVVMLCVGCSDPGPTESKISEPSPSLLVHSASDDLRPGERSFVELAEAEQSFAGFFVEGDSLIVLTSQSGRKEALRQTVTAAHASLDGAAQRLDGTERPIGVRVVQYSFEQLSAWREVARPLAWALDDVVGIDLDERQNVLAFHMATGSDSRPLRRELLGEGIPDNAFVIEITGRSIGMSTLSSHKRPLTGGYTLGIKDPLAQPWSQCTFGFNAVLGGNNVFVTNSHCTKTVYGYDGSAGYQHTVFSSSDWIGYESVDPTGFSCSPWPWKPKCRNADVAAFLHNSTSIGFGRIARTTYRSSTGMGSLTIDSSSPHFTITGEDSWPATGEIVNKVGQSGGWTYGLVSDTCVEETFDRTSDGAKWTVTCAYKGLYYGIAGDSGSPVFKWSGSGNNIVLQGIHFGGDKDNDLISWFSPMGSIEADLGPLTVYTAPPPPLTATIGGPNEVPEDAYCTWQGFGGGGTPPYNYSWSGVLSGSGSTKSGTVNSSGWLYLTVTDAASGTASAQRYITVDEDADECLEQE